VLNSQDVVAANPRVPRSSELLFEKLRKRTKTRSKYSTPVHGKYSNKKDQNAKLPASAAGMIAREAVRQAENAENRYCPDAHAAFSSGQEWLPDIEMASGVPGRSWSK
jgi:hypothetical protein